MSFDIFICVRISPEHILRGIIAELQAFLIVQPMKVFPDSLQSGCSSSCSHQWYTKVSVVLDQYQTVLHKYNIGQTCNLKFSFSFFFIFLRFCQRECAYKHNLKFSSSHFNKKEQVKVILIVCLIQYIEETISVCKQ